MAGSLKIDVNVADWKRRMDRYRFKGIPQRRRQYVRSIMGDMLKVTTDFNPIRTGRSRASWVQSRSRLGYREQPTWKTEDPFPDPPSLPATKERTEGRRKSRLVWRERRHQTELQATSLVEYVVFLEYGTDDTPEFQMVRIAFELLEEGLESFEFKP
jgi:hypothetical protein